MEKQLNELQDLISEIASLSAKIDEMQIAKYFDNWIPRKILMQFLDYGDTQMAALFKSGELKISQIGNRKFIYKPSVIKYLEKNLKDN